MNANELRLGNLVNFMEDDTIFTVDEIVTDGVGVHNEEESTWIEIDQFSGIPLTEEWLLKFGFEPYYFRDNALSGWYKYGTKYLTKDNMLVWFDIQIKTVHQLQNLFFVLTGKELEVVNEA